MWLSNFVVWVRSISLYSPAIMSVGIITGDEAGLGWIIKAKMLKIIGSLSSFNYLSTLNFVR